MPDDIQAPWVGLCEEDYDEACGYTYDEGYADYQSEQADIQWELEQEAAAYDELQEEQK